LKNNYDFSCGNPNARVYYAHQQAADQPTEKMKSQLLVKQNPSNKAWYVLGDCCGYWMPISSPMKSKSQALRWAKGQAIADADARREAVGALSKNNQLQ